MAINNIFNIAGSGMNAQMVRLNTTASNLANASVVASSEKDAFHAKRAVFETLVNSNLKGYSKDFIGGVKVTEIVDDAAEAKQIHDPLNSLADENGFVYASSVSEVTEMVEMMTAARSYENNVKVMTTARQLMLRTLEISKA
ncbi:flagellar basal body rod protein FlgC [Pseudomonadales bacterium]|nr:flagellar basal body rod protein FlgC [Pseudomonadales bacterium]MDA9297689.1 flagellar basal body rod protein FlgC [Pseudomonadales bacterium]MDA9315734.1 flagellar basal body rod protein FlgC [Pseudomonadales bacterium]MDB4150728.1 flagellar basal body rod protein FlgC [Pseudomonadales bacterium]MDB9867966.1 flagellar basal body rod protein FlgC [Pseudomonadales bacterium]